jgi:hypothetical protein
LLAHESDGIVAHHVGRYSGVIMNKSILFRGR